MSDLRIVVTGAGGQLGSVIAERYASRADVRRLRRGDLDVTDAGAVAALSARERPDAIVNCAAYNDVDGAEARPLDALRTNAMAVRALALGAAGRGAVLVHYGTDFVFDGTAGRPYREDDEPAPLGVYGASKLLGEWFAAESPRHYVLRVSSLFGGGRGSQIDRIIAGLQRGERPRVFVDRTVSPSYAPDVADVTWRLIGGAAEPGLYHCVCSGSTTWFDLAVEIARQLDVPPDLTPVRMADVRLPARRPQHAALSNQRLAASGIVMPSWQDALSRHLHATAASRVRPADPPLVLDSGGRSDPR